MHAQCSDVGGLPGSWPAAYAAPVPTEPHILLVEDEPVSAGFMTDALADLARISRADSLRSAIAALRGQRFDLLLIDCQLPDGHGTDVLAAARDPGNRTNSGTPAIALSAELDPPLRQLLWQSGFAQCMSKPVSALDLCAAARSALAARSPPVWDDALAQRALGPQPDTLRALRALLRSDLPQHLQRIDRCVHQGDISTLRAELHTLRAACGFCGAVALMEAIEALRACPDLPNLQRLQAAGEALIGEA